MHRRQYMDQEVLIVLPVHHELIDDQHVVVDAASVQLFTMIPHHENSWTEVDKQNLTNIIDAINYRHLE